MKKPLLLLACLALSTHLFSQTQEAILHARIWLEGKTMLDLEKAGLEADHGFYEQGQSFRSEFAASELSRAKAAGFRIDTLDADVLATYLRENALRKPQRTEVSERGLSPCDAFGGASTATPTNYTYGSMGGYYTYEEYLAILDDMRAKFPQLISARQVVSPTLLTHEGRPLWFVRISDNPDSDEPEPEALYTALHHAREPNSLSHLIYFMWHLLENYDRDEDLRYLLNHTELYFIPCLNPDGYIYNQTTNPEGGGYWRKNRRDNGDGSYGVDLNRNYGYNWGNLLGSSNDPYSDVYHGPAPFSEPETQMAKNFIEAHNFEIVLNCHTSGNKLVHPWGYENSIPTPDFTTLSEWLTRENQYFHGSCWQTLGYLASGTSDDWAFGEKDIFAFTPETGFGFWPTIDNIDGNNKGMLLTNLSAAWYALGGAVIRQHGIVSLDPDLLEVPFRINQYEIGTAPIVVSFEALTPNIESISGPGTPFSLNNFEYSDFTATVHFNTSLQVGELVRFVAKAERLGQVHTDTFEIKYSPYDYESVFVETAETNGFQWISSQWGKTEEFWHTPGRSITDSPNDIYTAEENTLTSLQLVKIPANATEARLRFFARWDIGYDLDWAQVLASKTDDNLFMPLEGALSSINPSLLQPVYEGNHPFWEEECIDLQEYIGESFFLRFAMTSFSGNFEGHDGFYFDDLILEYQTDGGVFTHDIPDAWRVQSRPNPAAEQVNLVWEIPASSQFLQLEICAAAGNLFRKIQLPSGHSNACTIETSDWPAGTYFYRMTNQAGNSGWKKLAVVH